MEYFKKIGLDHKNWYDRSLCFHEALKTLEKEYTNNRLNSKLYVPMLFNAAHSIELLLKATLVKRSGTMCDSTHNLLKLCKQVNIPLNNNEEKIIKIFSYFEVHGKYPCALRDEDSKKQNDLVHECGFSVKAPNGNTFIIHKPELSPIKNYYLIWEKIITEYLK